MENEEKLMETELKTLSDSTAAAPTMSPLQLALEQLRVTPDRQLPPMDFLFQLFGSPCFPRRELVAITGKAKIGIACKGAQSAEKFTVSENVKGLHVVFSPERTTDSAGNRQKQFLQNCKVEELPLNTVVKETPEP